jgi:predicted component of type VI protein secretion system
MSLHVTVFDPETGQTREHAFIRSPVRIGRDAGNELRLPFSFVSGRHAVLQFDDERAELLDAGSTNGVLREGRRLPSRQAVPIGDTLTVTIGRLELRVRRLTADDSPSAPPIAPEAAAADATGLARVHGAIRDLRPLYIEMLQARSTFVAARDAALAGIPAEARDLADAMLAREFPDPAK